MIYSVYECGSCSARYEAPVKGTQAVGHKCPETFRWSRFKKVWEERKK